MAILAGLFADLDKNHVDDSLTSFLSKTKVHPCHVSFSGKKTAPAVTFFFKQKKKYTPCYIFFSNKKKVHSLSNFYFRQIKSAQPAPFPDNNGLRFL